MSLKYFYRGHLKTLALSKKLGQMHRYEHYIVWLLAAHYTWLWIAFIKQMHNFPNMYKNESVSYVKCFMSSVSLPGICQWWRVSHVYTHTPTCHPYDQASHSEKETFLFFYILYHEWSCTFNLPHGLMVCTGANFTLFTANLYF